MFNQIEAIEAIKARINGDFDNKHLQSLSALSTDCLSDIMRVIINTRTDTDWFDMAQAQAILDNNEQYDILLFVQIPYQYFHADLLAYIKANSTFIERGFGPEFMFRTCKLKDEAIDLFDRYKDKTAVNQCRKLAADLSSVQYIHVIE